MKVRTKVSTALYGTSVAPLIALTREAGANDKLRDLIKDYTCVEIPCIAFEVGADASQLSIAMTTHDLVAITSPQSASIFLEAWRTINKPPIRVVTVGKGTSKPLEKEGIKSVFTPSDFNAETLAKELPVEVGKTILYPTSAIAENTLQNGLESRGFQVTRINTYSTVPATWTEEQTALARTVDIVTIGSPSAAKTWAERVGTDFIAVVIGPTSARAAEKLGFKQVLCPEGSKGIEAWADLVKKAAASCSA